MQCLADVSCNATAAMLIMCIHTLTCVGCYRFMLEPYGLTCMPLWVHIRRPLWVWNHEQNQLI